MKPIRIPTFLIIVILVAISLAFLFGTLRAFDSVHAAAPITSGTLSLADMAGSPEEPVPTGEPTSTPAPLPTPPSADTTGIIILAIVVVAIIVFGAAWGGRKTPGIKK